MLILTRSEVERLLPMADCIGLMRAAMAGVSAGAAVLPLRQFMAVPGREGKLGLMPGYLAGAAGDVFGVKLVSKFPRPPGDPHGSHVGMVALFGADDGLPLALMEGGSLTAIRTAAASAMATDVLARPACDTLLILGAGEEARRHVEALALVRPPQRIRIWARNRDRAAAFIAGLDGVDAALDVVDDLPRAVAEADIIATTTSAPEPILEGRWLRQGQHLVLVGSAIATTAEVDVETVARGRFFVDYRPAALAQAGELKRAIDAGRVGEDHIAAEIGEVVTGAKPGRRSAEEITIYKSLGVTAQDLAAAQFLYAQALAQGAGQHVDLGG